MSQTPNPQRNRRQYWLNLTLAGIAGQVGCLTIVIILIAVLGGLWLDAQFQTRPLFTIVLLIASIPISLGLMFFVVRAATSKIKAGPPPEKSGQTPEEVDIGRDT
jgi:F0F1-type ATP synthase assembly protein I